MSNNMMGAAFQYYAEVTGEKVAAARERVVARGVLPNSRISPGYVRGEDGVLVVERPKARIVVQAFRRRDRGASLVEIQAFWPRMGSTVRSPGWSRCCARGSTWVRSTSASCTTRAPTSR